MKLGTEALLLIFKTVRVWESEPFVVGGVAVVVRLQATKSSNHTREGLDRHSPQLCKQGSTGPGNPGKPWKIFEALEILETLEKPWNFFMKPWKISQNFIEKTNSSIGAFSGLNNEHLEVTGHSGQ